MRLLNKSLTESVYSAINEQSDAKQAVYDVFDGTDFFVNEVYSVGDGVVKFNVTAIDGDDNELNRDVEVAIPNDDYYDIKQDSYDAVFNCVEAWRDEHNSPELFYENVMISTGSTTVTSDETGVTVEDNGNSITSGNGVNINIDNEADVLPAEDDIMNAPIEEPTEEIPDELVADVPEEDIENVEAPEEDTEDINEEVLEKPSEENDEEINNSKIEEADGYNQNQNVEIYQNPEFDYQILDITELDNVDTGDIRAIDMANILNDLDESLTEMFGTPYWGDMNSFLTRRGKHNKTNESYSSAILQLTLPKLNESINQFNDVFILEVYGDKAIKECIVRDAESHIIKEYSGKSKNPAKHFEGVILDIMYSRLLKEGVETMINEPEKEDNINFANSKAVDKDKERQEKHLKQHNARNKESKKFKVEKEPDQDNTTGKTEEEATDTAEVEALPKAKKTKVNSEKLKVKELKESDSIDELKNFIEGLINEAEAYPENNPGYLYSQAIGELKDSGLDNLASYLSDCDNRCDSSYIEGCSVIEDLTYVLSELNDMNESAKLTEAEDELLDEPIVTDGSEPEDELDESGSDVAIFHRKPASVDAMRAAEQNGITVNKSNYKIIGTKELSADEFNNFANHLSSGEFSWLEEFNDTSNSGEFKCVEVINTEDDSYSILVDPQGYNYARYAAIKENLSNEEGLLDEPTEETEEEVNNEE